MNIEGFIDFYSKHPFTHNTLNNEKVIAWNSNYIKLSEKEGEVPFRICVGVEIETEVKLLGSKMPGDLTSSLKFIDYLKNPNVKIDIGIWFDKANNNLLIARQAFGMCPLYYMHIPNEFIAFSTSLVSLVQMPPLRAYLSLDSQRIVETCTFRKDPSADYAENTFYERIKSALPGQILSLTAEGKSYSPFLKFEISDWTSLKSLSEYGEAFRQILIESVADNTHHPAGLLGSHLSGGLDSSSISSITKMLHPDRPLHTFYYSTRNYANDDNMFARSVAEKIGSVHHELTQSTDDLAIIQSNTAIYGRPLATFISPSSEATVNRLVQGLGCNVLLNGSDGDSIVGSGLEMTQWLYQNNDWIKLKELLSNRVKYFSFSHHYSNWDNLTFEEKASIVEQNFIYHRLTSEIRQSGLLVSAKRLKEISKHFDLSFSYFFKRGLTSLTAKQNKKSIQPLTMLRDDFQESAKIRISSNDKLSKILRGDLPIEYSQWFEDVYNQHSMSLNEERFALGNFYGFKNTSPFYDKRLFELCISIPALVKFGDGQGRVHFREAMKGILPEHVRLRHEKASVGSFGREVTLRLYDQAQELLLDSDDVWKYMDKTKFFKTLKFLKTDGLEVSMYNRSLFHVTKTVSLAVWFEWLKSENLPITI